MFIAILDPDDETGEFVVRKTIGNIGVNGYSTEVEAKVELIKGRLLNYGYNNLTFGETRAFHRLLEEFPEYFV